MDLVNREGAKLTELQRAILSELQKDGRISFRELAKKLHFSPPTIAANLHELETSGVIQKFTVQLDFKKMGFLMRAIVCLSVPHQDIETGVYDALKAIPQVVRYFRATGTFDYYVEVAALSLADLDNALSRLGKIGKTQSSIVMDSWEDTSRYLPSERD